MKNPPSSEQLLSTAGMLYLPDPLDYLSSQNTSRRDVSQLKLRDETSVLKSGGMKAKKKKEKKKKGWEKNSRYLLHAKREAAFHLIKGHFPEGKLFIFILQNDIICLCKYVF